MLGSQSPSVDPSETVCGPGRRSLPVSAAPLWGALNAAKPDSMHRTLICGIRPLLCAALTVALLGACMADPNRPMQLVEDAGPAYPEAARAEGIEGWVQLRYDISIDGRVENLKVLESSPPGVFDAAAMAAVAQWRYRVAVIDGVPSPVSGVVSTLRFELGAAERYEGY